MSDADLAPGPLVTNRAAEVARRDYDAWVADFRAGFDADVDSKVDAIEAHIAALPSELRTRLTGGAS